ncbi:MAG: PAS domain S-box protein [Candidatus Binatia bacterium]
MEGVDYRGVPVLAAVRTVPDSPWFLVARMDVSEVYAPVRERRWMTAIVVAALLTSVGAGARLLWWRQNARLYEELSRASVALRDSAALNRDVLDALTANVAVLDAYGTIVTVNERWRRFARENQASTDGNDFVGVNYLAVCEKSKGPGSDAGAQAALVGIGAVMDGSQTQFSLEYPCHSPDQQRWFLMYVSPLGDSRGGVVVAHLDITERRRLEHELRSQNAALEAAANAVAITDWGGVIQWVNPAFTALTGYAREEAIGRNPRDLVKSGKHDHAFYAALWRTILAGQVWHGEMVNRRKDGSLYTEEQTITPLRDERGEISQFIAIKQDISERTRAETALRESQARLNGIVDSAMDGIVTIDDQERIVVFNAAAEKMFGCPAIEAIGQPVERFIPERFRAAHHGHLRHFSQTGDTQRAAGQVIRVSALRAGGEEFPIEASISRTEVDGHLLLTIILRDVAERVRGEKARAQLEAQLRLAQKMEALGTLAGGIAHDFNNILGAIIGNAALARQDVGSSHPAVESLNEIRKASHRAKDLVQRILAFSSEQSRPRSVILLRPVVEETVTLLRATLPAGVAIVTAFDADTPTVLADPTQIHQVLMNLCTNAWHALEGHPGRIDIHLDGVTLDAEAADAVATLRPGRFARLSVTDTGKGMNADTVERIFDPFFTTKPVGQGTGLGLSVVHGIMKAHDGAVTVASQPGSGTTFHLYFPAAAAPQPPAAPEPIAVEPVPAAGVQHVLYLDDEESLVFLVTRTLERLGYRVSGYTQAEAALAAVRADPTQFDLVVTDLNMPGISGLEVARELSRLRPELPVVLASGYITEELRAHALQAGVRQLIYKPNTVEELCDVVQRLAGEPRSA